MRWRPLAAAMQGSEMQVYSQVPDDYGRSLELAEALARLEAATLLRDGPAVARILDGLRSSDDGQWLLRQCVAAGLREVASVIADTDHTPGRSTPGRSAGAA